MCKFLTVLPPPHRYIYEDYSGDFNAGIRTGRYSKVLDGAGWRIPEDDATARLLTSKAGLLHDSRGNYR